MIHALFLSLGQLLDRRVAAVFLKSLALTALLFAAAGVGLWWGLHWLIDNYGPWMGISREGGVVADIMTIVVMLFAWWLLFRAIAIGVVGIFADEVVAAVEARHYPQAHAAARDVPFARSVAMGLRSALRLIVINLLFAPVYIVLLVTGVGTAIAFFVVNSWLLGRDLGDMVAARHMGARDLPKWRQKTSFRRFMLGSVGTGVMLVPVLNLIGPILGAAMATHAYHLGKTK
ncbi:EI24 domain-containing protein [Sphingomonas sp. AOB5]|uniref:EI24 domain-containing protein n=1 Tax=Sphingomonas sp. AOB5 TaxID=3034017 RepID=UPI0023F88167|nr:EI24 domain-containing protein [Sphingomonas sp. AOB5]MDF7773742.1 EI24 domain-containing protein [Sphingomonas sp. AOB5]